MPMHPIGDMQTDYERLALSFRAFGGGLWDYDVDADRLFCSQRWYDLIGIDPAVEQITSIGAFRPHIHPDDAARATEFDADGLTALIEQDERYHIEFRIVRPGGECRWWRSVACVVRDAATGHHRAVGCVMDISDQRLEAAIPKLPTPVDAPPHSLEVKLTDRERESLMWVSVGKTAWETSVITGLSRRTIEGHLASTIRKLGAANKVHAAVLAISQGLL
jgi:DNA-binding CsgD family transcriptional regulator